MVQIRSPTFYKAPEILGRSNGRRGTVDANVRYREMLPAELANRIKVTSTKTGQKCCMTEMQAMIACLSKTDNNQAMCSNEIKRFQSCFEKFRVEDAKLQEIKQKGVRPVGSRAKLSGEQMNAYMKEFPRSRSKR